MKLSRISLAMAAACGTLASAPAFAITASNYNNTGEFTGDTLNIRVSGATAQDNGILGTALSVCVAGSVHRYAISNNFVFYCTPDIGTGAGQIQVPTGKTKLAIYKYSVGGSAFGVSPINSDSATDGSVLGSTGNLLPFLDLTKLNTACTGTNAAVTTPIFGGTLPGALGTYTNVACNASVAAASVTTPATTYVGVSDVEPAFFASDISNITAVNTYALVFGVPVSKNLRDALQTQQGLTVNDETENGMPSLTSAQLASAYTQVGQTWNSIGVSFPGSIFVARRVDSSGTQKTFEALVAQTPNGQGGLKNCAVGTDAFVLPDSGNVSGTSTAGDPADTEDLCTSGSTVVALSGGGNVRACLANHSTAGRGAIGILTTEDKPGSALWRFVKVDGIAPTQAQAANGRYRYYDESTLNTRTSGSFATSGALGYGPVVARLRSDFSNPAIIKLINGSDQTFGAAGLMALRSKQPTPRPAPDFTGASSVIPWSKLVSGTTLDNCQAPKALF